MKTKDILTITTAALGTATLTVAAFWAGPTDAGHDADAPPAKIAKPRLISHGVEMALAPPAAGPSRRAMYPSSSSRHATRPVNPPAPRCVSP